MIRCFLNDCFIIFQDEKNLTWFVLTYMRLKNTKDTEGTFDTSKLVTNKSAYKISFKEFCKLFAAEQETVTSLV